MKNLMTFLTIATITLASQMARADMANGTYNYYSSSNAPLWDISGEYTGTLEGIDMDFTISQDPSGNYQGTGTFSYDDAWTQVDLSGDVNANGKVTGTPVNPAVTMDLAINGSGTVRGDDVNFAANAKIKFGVASTNGNLSASSGSVSVTVTDLTTGKKATRSEPLSKGDTFPLPSNATGNWALTLNLTPNGTKYTGTAVIQTSTGGLEEYTAIGTYSSKTDTSNIKLIGPGSAVTVVIATSGPSMTVKSIKGKAFGQSVNFGAASL